MSTQPVKYVMDLNFYREGKWAASKYLRLLDLENPGDPKTVDYMVAQLWLGNFQWFRDNPAEYTSTNHGMASLRAGQNYVCEEFLSTTTSGVQKGATTDEWFDRPGEVISTFDWLHNHDIPIQGGINWSHFKGIPASLIDEFKLVCKEDATMYDLHIADDGTGWGRYHH